MRTEKIKLGEKLIESSYFASVRSNEFESCSKTGDDIFNSTGDITAQVTVHVDKLLMKMNRRLLAITLVKKISGLFANVDEKTRALAHCNTVG